MPRILYKPDLDDTQCANPLCLVRHTEPMSLHAGCHPEASLNVAYAVGVLYLTCAVCATPVTAIAVKERPDG